MQTEEEWSVMCYTHTDESPPDPNTLDQRCRGVTKEARFVMLERILVNDRLAAPPAKAGGMPALRAGLLAARLHPKHSNVLSI